MSLEKRTRNSSAFKRASDKASTLAKSADAVLKLVSKTFRKLERAAKSIGAVGSFITNIRTLGRMLNAYYTGRYTNIPWGTIVKSVAGLLYFVMPFDLIPDFIIGVGFLDDIAIIGWIVASINDDIKEFRAWEAEQEGTDDKTAEKETVDTPHTVVEG